MAVVTIAVQGEILDLDNSTPAVGTVTFRTLTELRDTAANVVYEPATYTATLDGLGQFSLDLPATDSPDVTPSGWLYQVHISTTTWRSTFYISLPATLAPSVDFADLPPAIPTSSGVDGSAYAPFSLVARVEALEQPTEGPVVSVNGQTGIVTLNAASVGADAVGTVAAHIGAADPHGDRSWAAGQFLPRANPVATGTATLGSKNSLSGINFCGITGTYGRPTSGTWATGDCVMDSHGSIFICSAGGTPGTWVGNAMPEGIPNVNTATAAYYMTPSYGVSSTTATLANGQVWMSPLILQSDALMSEIVTQVTTPTATGTLRLGVADSNSDGMPGSWLVDFGTVTPSTTGLKTLTPNLSLQAGKRYWLGLVAQGTAGNCVVQARSGWDPRVPIEIPGAALTSLAFSRTSVRTAVGAVGGALSGAITLADTANSGPCFGIRLL